MNRFLDFDHGTKKLPPVYGYWSVPLVSLEESLRPIFSYIDQLPRYIKVAKENCHFPSKHGLTHDESAAVYIYSMEWGDRSVYKALNNALRAENRSIIKRWFSFLKLFDTAIQKLPTVKASLWRGVPKDLANEYKKGQKLVWWGVSSCSFSVNVIQSFINSTGTLFMIEAITGKNIKKYSYLTNEDEVLLMPGTHLCVTSNSYKHAGGLNVIHLKEISSENNEELPSPLSTVHISNKKSSYDTASTVTGPVKEKNIQTPHYKKPPNQSTDNASRHSTTNLSRKKHWKNNARPPSSTIFWDYQKPTTITPIVPEQSKEVLNPSQPLPTMPNHVQQYPAISNHINSFQPSIPVLSNVPSNSIQTFVYPDGVYEGTFQNGLRHGHGTFRCSKCGHIYVGSWANDKPNGQGAISLPDGSRYQGFWQDGLKSGFGIFDCGECGHRYEGNFMNDLMNGQGVFIAREGWRYEGTFLNGNKHGWGRMVYANGFVVAGNWFNGVFMN